MNAGLRGHQFVKEGAEEVLKRNLPLNMVAQFIVERSKARFQFSLLTSIWHGDQGLLNGALVDLWEIAAVDLAFFL